MNSDQVPMRPGDNVKEPNDLEVFFLGRIESRLGRDFRSTTKWDDPLRLNGLINLDKSSIQGQSGFTQ